MNSNALDTIAEHYYAQGQAQAIEAAGLTKEAKARGLKRLLQGLGLGAGAAGGGGLYALRQAEGGFAAGQQRANEALARVQRAAAAEKAQAAEALASARAEAAKSLAAERARGASALEAAQARAAQASEAARLQAAETLTFERARALQEGLERGVQQGLAAPAEGARMLMPYLDRARGAASSLADSTGLRGLRALINTPPEVAAAQTIVNRLNPTMPLPRPGLAAAQQQGFAEELSRLSSTFVQ